jgi:trypsin-like peptidase
VHKPIFALIAAQMVGMLFSPQQSAAMTTQEIVAVTKPSIVIINVFDAKQQPLGLGTGFFISDRQIVTNSHVIHDAEYVSIKGLDDSQYHYRGMFLDDPSVDLAIIEVSNSPDHSYLPVRKTVPVEGQNIVVIGNPEGEKGTVTTGIVSANRGPFFLFSAPISPGSSGSPILDEDGYVVGVVKGSRNDTQSQNMNLAVAASNINVGNESPDSPVTQNTPPVDEVPSLALRTTPNATPDATWPNGRILTHPEHFVSSVSRPAWRSSRRQSRGDVRQPFPPLTLAHEGNRAIQERSGPIQVVEG